MKDRNVLIIMFIYLITVSNSNLRNQIMWVVISSTDKVFEVQSLPISKTNWYLSLMIKNYYEKQKS